MNEYRIVRKKDGRFHPQIRGRWLPIWLGLDWPAEVGCLDEADAIRRAQAHATGDYVSKHLGHWTGEET